MTDGGPAFPLPGGSSDFTVQKTHLGMTLRDYFAGQAMASIPIRTWDGDGQEVIDAWARCAYAIADAMLAVRSDAEGKS